MLIQIKSNQLEAIEGITAEFPYVMHDADLSTTVVPWHWHHEIEFNYIIQGDVEVSTTSQKYVFQKNQAFFINTNILCTMQPHSSSKKGRMYSHLMDPVFLSGHFKSVFQTKYMEPILQNQKIGIVEIKGENPRQHGMLQKLLQVSKLAKQKNTEFQIRNMFSEIWLLLMEEIEEIETNRLQINLEKQNRIQTMLSYIQMHYMDKISLQDIADSALIGKRECLRCFEVSIKQTPFEYLISYRLEMAEKLLKNTQYNITDIALQTGFSNSAYFAKLFKDKFGMSPREYRKNI